MSDLARHLRSRLVADAVIDTLSTEIVVHSVKLEPSLMLLVSYSQLRVVAVVKLS